MTKEIPGISAVRAIAALLIVNYHTKRLQIPVLGLFATGGFILNIIFVGLSGYLLMNRYQAREIDKTWYKRRFLRIYPSYWLSLIITFLFTVSFNLAEPETPFLLDFLFSITGLQYFFGIETYGEHLWFVALIIVCYFGFNLTRNLLIKHRNTFLLSIVLVILALAVVRFDPESGLLLSLDYSDLWLRISASPVLRFSFHYLIFVLGMFAAQRNKDFVNVESRSSLVWVVIMIGSFVGYLLLSRIADTGLINVLAIFLALVCSYSFLTGIGNLFRSSGSPVNHVLNFISSFSYELYLIHFVFVSLFQKYLPGSLAAYLLVFVLGLLFAYLINTASSKLTKPFAGTVK